VHGIRLVHQAQEVSITALRHHRFHQLLRHFLLLRLRFLLRLPHFHRRRLHIAQLLLLIVQRRLPLGSHYHNLS
jgi:hypothetical protein